MKPFISLCMIVKNEEKVIERCLSSVSHLVDETIIVDTGSTDDTKNIIRKFTSNIYDFTWINDFSAARNFAASKANGEWILVLDADEYIDAGNFKEFLDELKNHGNKYDAFTAKILNFTGIYGNNLIQNYHDRIYKNNGHISYFRSIHEQFKSNNDDQLKVTASSLLIFHSGYLNKTVEVKDKRNRNKELIDNEMKNGSYKAFDYFNLGNEYCSMGEYSKALDSYLEAYKLKQDFRLAWVSTTLVQIIICLMNLKKYNDALNVIKDAEQLYATSPEIPFLKGEIFFLRGQMEDAKEMFLQIVNNEEKYQHIILRPDLKDQRPHIRLGEIYLQQEDYQGAIFHFSSVLNINKYEDESIKQVVHILSKFHSVIEVSAFLSSKELVNSRNINSYIRACFDCGSPDLALSLLDYLYEDNKLLYKVGLLKQLLIKKEGNIEQLDEILDITVFSSLLQSDWINVVDLVLLREYINRDVKVAKLLNHFKNESLYIELCNLIDNSSANIHNEDLFLVSVQKLLSYKEYNLISILLSKIQGLSQEGMLQVARTLFSNEFKVEALTIYEKVEWSNFKEADFLNIISSLIQTDTNDTANEVSGFAISIYNEDFRFYKSILENTQNLKLYNDTLQKAKDIFLDSSYLMNLDHGNLK